ncbi:MAG TPA: phosphoribosylanthranilate isomerase [Acidimicrobiia bacterium]|nr:phosphoribosylanthranilate isomerase [Acidimicrobiia bacterium]
MGVRVKICGITHPDDLALAVDEGADALGFVVEYPDANPWILSRKRAAELMRMVPPFVTRVAVVGATGDGAAAARSILDAVDTTEPHALQLHRDETEACVEELARSLDGSGIRLVKALRIDASVPGPPADVLVAAARRFVDAGADAVLVDSVVPGRPAGTGRAVDWNLARTVVDAGVAPCILAGGLDPDNVGRAVAAVRPFAVDVISSVEDADHRKVREKVRAFIRAATAAGDQIRL